MGTECFRRYGEAAGLQGFPISRVWNVTLDSRHSDMILLLMLELIQIPLIIMMEHINMFPAIISKFVEFLLICLLLIINQLQVC